MNQSLQPGQNTTLAQARGQVRVSHTASADLDVNLTAFLVTASGKVINDDDMVFFNAPQHASGAATFIAPAASGATLSHCIDFDLSRLPAEIVKIAVTLTQDGSAAGFASVNDLRAQIVAGSQTLELAPGAFSQETGIIVLELYVRNGENKARAVWQGFNSGLAGLCNLYGIEVESPAPVTPPVSLKKVTLTKPDAQHKVSLVKGAGAPKSIRVSATWICASVFCARTVKCRWSARRIILARLMRIRGSSTVAMWSPPAPRHPARKPWRSTRPFHA